MADERYQSGDPSRYVGCPDPPVPQLQEPISVTLDMDGSESPTRGDQKGLVWNGHLGRTCYHPLVMFNQPPKAAEMRRGDEKAVLRNYEVRSRSGGLSSAIPG